MDIIKDITEFIFIEDEPVRADIIFIPGSALPIVSEKSAQLWCDGYAPYIMPSGKYGKDKGYFPGPKSKTDIYKGPYETECDFMTDVLVKCGVSCDKIIMERESEYTKSNAFLSRKVLDEKDITINTAIICCKTFHARRVMMLYKWAFPEAELKIITVDPYDINKNNWYKTDYGIKRVMGELERCGSQLIDAVPFYRKNIK